MLLFHDEDLRQLQQNLLRSHSCRRWRTASTGSSSGNAFASRECVGERLFWYSACCYRAITEISGADILPVIPSRGSVGSSGDLAPLAHLALALTGEGFVTIPEKSHSSHGTHASHRMNVPDIGSSEQMRYSASGFEAKEGLALINGTQMMAAIGCLALHRA